MDEAGGIEGDLTIRGTFGSGGLQGYRTTFSNVSDYKKRQFLNINSDYIRDELYHFYREYNKNIAKQVEACRYATNVDVIGGGDLKERKVRNRCKTKRCK